MWTEGAADDLAGIVDYIRRDNPDAGRRVARIIFEEIMSLTTMPYRGRKRLTDNSRELVLAPWPYVAVYEVIEDKVYVKAIRHTSRNLSR
jgi:plasmid stabilization system protein ParE